MRREDGAILTDSKQTATTLRCCHCGGHFLSVPGSGAMRSFCRNCMDVTCGAPACVSRCLPFEKWLDRVERAGKRG